MKVERPAAYRIPLFAEEVGFKKSTIYQMIREGALKTVTIRGQLRIPASELDRLLGNTDSQQS